MNVWNFDGLCVCIRYMGLGMRIHICTDEFDDLYHQNCKISEIKD